MKIRVLLLVLWFLSIPALGQDQPKIDSSCRIRVRIINFVWGNPDTFRYDSLSANQLDWWLKDGQKKFPDICITTEKGISDYVIAWTSTESMYTFTYTAPSISTTEHQGRVITTNGSGTYSGTSETITYESKQGNRVITFVNASVHKTTGELGERKIVNLPIFVARNKGQWRWSKPDKDAFEKALKVIAKRDKQK